MMRTADRLERIPDSFWGLLSKTVSEMEASGRDIIRLDVGDPDMPPSEEVVGALREAVLRPDLHGYAGGRGSPELRSAIAEYYDRRFSAALDPESEIVPLLGSKEGIAHIAWAFVNPGDYVIVPEPAYPTYRLGAYLAGGEVYAIELTPEQDYAPDLTGIPADVCLRAKLLWLNYPHNPTGATTTLDALAQAVAFARRHDILVCHDAPYASVTYEGYRPPSILQVPGAKDVAVEFNSLSKTYNMAGWRVAMAVGSSSALRGLMAIKSNTDSGLFAPVQMAATAALRGDQGWLEERNAIYQERRDIIVSALESAGLAHRKPLGGLYVWAQTPEGTSSDQFVATLLRETGVSIVPGSMYGLGGEGHVRISVTKPAKQVREAMRRLTGFLARG